MKTTLFLDVDGVLTLEPANLQLARFLGVSDQLETVENDYSAGRLATDVFGRNLVALFREAGLSQRFVADNFDRIRKRIGYEKLLSQPDSTFLVSSGPNYFVDRLAEQHHIDASHVICSRYAFDSGEQGLINRCVEPIGAVAKANFVRRFVSGTNLSIGVGDTPELDSQFLSHCDIEILVDEWRNGYLCVRDLQPVIDLVDSLTVLDGGVQDDAADRPIHVFIGSSSEQKQAASAIQANIESDTSVKIESTVWDQIPHGLGDNFLTTLLKESLLADFAVLVFGADDLVQSRGTTSAAPRDNVLLECGVFMGALGVGRVFLVVKASEGVKMPTDLSGVTCARFQDREDGNIQGAVGKACFEILRAIKSKGRRSRPKESSRRE